jgi:hypothetical protein
LYGTVESHQLKAGKAKDVHLCTCHVFIEIINTSEGEIRKNIFDIRYNANLDAAEDEWRNCTQVLPRRSIDSFMRKGWMVRSST